MMISTPAITSSSSLCMQLLGATTSMSNSSSKASTSSSLTILLSSWEHGKGVLNFLQFTGRPRRRHEEWIGMNKSKILDSEYFLRPNAIFYARATRSCNTFRDTWPSLCCCSVSANWESVKLSVMCRCTVHLASCWAHLMKRRRSRLIQDVSSIVPSWRRDKNWKPKNLLCI